MTMSMFPDRFPDDEPKPLRDQQCCGADEPPPLLSHLLWQWLHTYAHGRVPFTAAQLATTAGVSDREALSAIRAAGKRGWVQTVVPERNETNPPYRWVGTLRRR